MELKLFVYGTLKPGQARYQDYSDNVINACAAIAQGQLFALPAGYPAMVLGEGWVHGFALSFRDQSIFDLLDEYEGYQAGRDPDQNLYERQLVETFDLTEQFSVRASGESAEPLKLTAEAYGNAERLRQGGHVDTCRVASRRVRRSLALGKSLGSAWAYLMMPERVYQMGGTRLPSGQWV